MRSWPPGRLVVQLLLLCVLAVMCLGLLSPDGAIGLVAIMGVALLAYACVRALTKRR